MIYNLILCPSLRPDSLSTHLYLNHLFPCRLWLRPPTGVSKPPPPTPCPPCLRGATSLWESPKGVESSWEQTQALNIPVRGGLSLKPQPWSSQSWSLLCCASATLLKSFPCLCSGRFCSSSPFSHSRCLFLSPCRGARMSLCTGTVMPHLPPVLPVGL